VGDRRYVNYVKLEYYRWVNNNDIVPRVPPIWFGYRHAGTEMYLDRRGRLRKLRGWRRFRDRWWGFVHGLRRWRIDHLSDHNMGEYLAGIRKVIEQDEGITFDTPVSLPPAGASISPPEASGSDEAHAPKPAGPTRRNRTSV
jgi:triacylglycerol lipase